MHRFYLETGYFQLRKSLQQPSQPLNVPEDTGLWEHSNIPKVHKNLFDLKHTF